MEPPPASATGVQLIRRFVAGRYVDGARSFDKISPVDGSLVGRVQEAGRAQVDAVVAAARAALDGSWGRTAVQDRVRVLRRVADVMERRFEVFGPVAALIPFDTEEGTLGAENVMVGSDYPYPLGERPVGNVVHKSDFLDDETRAALLGGNATRFVGISQTHQPIDGRFHP